MISGSDPVSLWLKGELETFGATAERIAERSSRLYEPGASTLHIVAAPPSEYDGAPTTMRAE